MRVWLRIISVLLAIVSGTATASQAVAIDWADLPDPAMQDFDDPFRDLSPEQFDDVVLVLRLQRRLQRGLGSADERQTWQQLLTDTEDALAADGIDIAWLLSQREAVLALRTQARTAGNPDLHGQTVTLTGFAIPAPPDEQGKPTAYLVPERGMCSHTPPPPSNQMVRIQFNGDWAPAYVYVPIRVTGTLKIDPSERAFEVVDGLVPMRATFSLNATGIDDLGGTEDAESARRSLLERIRASDHNKTGGSVVGD